MHARRDIQAGEELLYVPKEGIITLEMAEESPIGAKMMKAQLKKRLLSSKHSFLTTFVLQEKRKAGTPWWSFIDILPKDMGNFPIFFEPEEKEWLKGSPFLEQVEEKIEDIKQDYELICDEVPEYREFPIKEFSEIRMMVSSRIFGMNIEDKKTDGFVPLAGKRQRSSP